MGTKYKGKPLEISALDAYISLRRATNAISAHLNKHLDEANLTSGQFGVMEALYHLGPLSQRDIGKKLLSTKGNITMIIDNLEQQGFVKRIANTEDRRFITVQLTAQGKAKMGKLVPKHVEKITKVMSVLTQQELHELKVLCKKVGLSIKDV